MPHLLNHKYQSLHGASVSLVASVLFLGVGCCTDYKLRVVDLVTDLPLAGTTASVEPTTTAGLLGGKLDTLYSTSGNDSGHVEVKGYCNGAHYVQVSHRPTRRYLWLSRLDPKVEVHIVSHRRAIGLALEKWIDARRLKRADGVIDIPVIDSLANTTGILSPDDVLTVRDPAQTLLVDIYGDRANDDALLQLDCFPNIRFLSVRSTQITDAGLVRLSTYRHLMSIDLWPSVGMTADGIQRLRNAMPDTVIVVHKSAPLE